MTSGLLILQKEVNHIRHSDSKPETYYWNNRTNRTRFVGLQLPPNLEAKWNRKTWQFLKPYIYGNMAMGIYIPIAYCQMVILPPKQKNLTLADLI